MANAGFSAPLNYWGSITGLTPKSSSGDVNTQTATATNALGDVVASDRTSLIMNPVVEYAVTDIIETNLKYLNNTVVKLGQVVSFGTGTTYKLLITNVTVTTSAGSPPIVKISGVQVDSGAATKRTYPISLNLSPRSKAQDVAGAFELSGSSVAFSSVETIFSVDPVVQTVGGSPVVHDVANGMVTANATVLSSGGAYSCSKSSGFDVFIPSGDSRPDAGYLTRTVAAYKYLQGTDI